MLFKKPPSKGAKNLLGNKDRKKLRLWILQAFPKCTEDDVDTFLLPKNEESTVVKVQGSKIHIYFSKNDPVFFDVDGNGDLFPTIYALCRFPSLIDCFLIHPPVSQFILKGADLMLPGVIKPENYSSVFGELGLLRKKKMGVKVIGNNIPFAVGRCLTTTPSLISGDSVKGKALEVLHLYSDHLWLMGTRDTPNDGFSSPNYICALNPPYIEDPEAYPSFLYSTNNDILVDDSAAGSPKKSTPIPAVGEAKSNMSISNSGNSDSNQSKIGDERIQRGHQVIIDDDDFGWGDREETVGSDALRSQKTKPNEKCEVQKEAADDVPFWNGSNLSEDEAGSGDNKDNSRDDSSAAVGVKHLQGKKEEKMDDLLTNINNNEVSSFVCKDSVIDSDQNRRNTDGSIRHSLDDDDDDDDDAKTAIERTNQEGIETSSDQLLSKRPDVCDDTKNDNPELNKTKESGGRDLGQTGGESFNPIDKKKPKAKEFASLRTSILDKFLELCLVDVCVNSLDDSQLPIEASAVFSKMVNASQLLQFHSSFQKLVKESEDIPIETLSGILFGTSLVPCDVKKSSYKKLSKFIQHYAKKKVFQTKDVRGTVLVVSVNYSLPLLSSYKSMTEKERKQAEKFLIGDSDTSNAPSSVPSTTNKRDNPTDGTIEVLELYHPDSNSQAIFDAVSAKPPISSKYYFVSDVRNVFLSYLNYLSSKRGENNNNRSHGITQDKFELDDVLRMVVLTKEERTAANTATTPVVMPKTELYMKFQKSLRCFHAITQSGSNTKICDLVIRHGKLKPVVIKLEKRQGRKAVTTVANIQSFEIDEKSLAEVLQRALAASATTFELTGAAKGSLKPLGVMVQGSFQSEVADILMKEFRVPKRFIEISSR